VPFTDYRFEGSASDNNDLEMWPSTVYVIKGVGCLAEAQSD